MKDQISILSEFKNSLDIGMQCILFESLFKRRNVLSYEEVKRRCSYVW